MVLSTFIIFNTEEQERIERVINDLDVHEFFDCKMWSIDFKLNTRLKTCLIGYNDIVNNIEELNDLDILNHEINNRLHWVFSYTEDKNFYRKVLTDYINSVINEYIQSFTYFIIDYFFTEDLIENTVKGLIREYIPTNRTINKSLVINRSLYFVLGGESIIYNISLKMIKYYNGTQGVGDILDYFQVNSKNHIHDINLLLYSKYRDIISPNILDNVLLERYLITLI